MLQGQEQKTRPESGHQKEAVPAFSHLGRSAGVRLVDNTSAMYLSYIDMVSILLQGTIHSQVQYSWHVNLL